MIRGIHATLYARISNKLDWQALFEQRYQDEVFVDVLPPGSYVDTRNVRGSNRCQIAIHQPQNQNTLVILSVIDNLVKGASGQAVQAMNIMFGFPENAGLEIIALYP
jgi:N-acetyl-gamma-glutamyl-phosphate reductase